jgi:hypothetical protein
VIPQIPDSFKPKSFWERPEGTTGMVFGIPALLIAGIGLFKLLPYIITLLQNTITAIALGVALFVMVYVLTDKRFRTLCWYAYKSIMRAITGIFVTIDPIGILNNYVDKLKQNAQDMNEQVANLRGQMRKLQITISQNEKNRIDALKMADAARKDEKNAVFVLKARKAGRLEESNMTLQNLYQRMELLYRVLIKMYETCLVLIEDMSDEVDVKTREREAILASYSAYKNAAKIISGETDKKEVFDMAMEYLADDYGKKLGEIENFMTISQSFIESVDLQNGIYEEDAMKKLEEWEKKGDSILLGDQKKLLIAQASDPNLLLDLNKPVEREKVLVRAKKVEDTDYKDLMK